MNGLRQLGTLLWKDLLLEFRTKEMLSAMLIFALLVIVIFAFAFHPTPSLTAEILPGLLWVTFAFAGVLGLNRSFTPEKTNDCLLGLLLAPMDRVVIYVAKLLGSFIFITIMEAIALPLFIVFFNYRLEAPIGWLVLTIILGTVGFAAVGTFLAALAANTRLSEVVLPLLVFPVIVPVLIAAVEATAGLLSGGQWPVIASWLRLMGVYDIIFLVVAALLFEYTLEV